MTIRRAAVPGRNFPDGFVDCGFAGPFTGIDAGSQLLLDTYTQENFIRSLTNADPTTHAKMVGTTIRATVSEPYAPGTDTLTLDIDDAGPVVTTFQATDTTAQLVVDRINAAFVTAGQPEPAVVGSELTLQLSGVLTGPNGEVDVVSGTGSILTALGLSVGVTAGTGAIKAFRYDGATPVFKGGGSPIAGEFYEANATTTGTAGVSGLGRRSPAPVPGNLSVFTWDTAAASIDTVMNIWADVGTGFQLVDTITLDGPSGELPLPAQFQNAKGDLVAVEFVSGTPPGAGIVGVLAQ